MIQAHPTLVDSEFAAIRVYSALADVSRTFLENAGSFELTRYTLGLKLRIGRRNCLQNQSNPELTNYVISSFSH
jgi:hypothetical protein